MVESSFRSATVVNRSIPRVSRDCYDCAVVCSQCNASQSGMRREPSYDEEASPCEQRCSSFWINRRAHQTVHRAVFTVGKRLLREFQLEAAR